ncbi:MAG: dipeptidase [Acidobacteriota bacterium]|nr:dipeptidase [Acidobacteriota bacterium]
MTHSRRHFLKQAMAATAAAAVPASIAGTGATASVQERPSLPYVDGLSFLSPDAQDVGRSGLTSFICDVSSVERLPTTDGSIKYFRSFEACAKSLTAMRRTLQAGQIPGAFLATRGSEVAEAFKQGRTAIFFQFQGCEPIGDQLWRLDLFHELGLRVQQITHHNDNPWGGGAIEKNWSGLTKVGFEGVERLNALKIIPDLSHGSDLTALDVLETSKSPVILSHGGARALVPTARCAPDGVIRKVGESGGVMGIFMMSMWLTTDPQPSVDGYVRQLRHVINVAGIDAVGIANDYTIAGELTAAKAGNDNAQIISNYYAWWDSVAKQGVMGFNTRPPHAVIPELNNVRRMYLLEEALRQRRFTQTEIEKIMGGNWVRVLRDVLG